MDFKSLQIFFLFQPVLLDQLLYLNEKQLLIFLIQCIIDNSVLKAINYFLLNKCKLKLSKVSYQLFEINLNSFQINLN